MNEVIKTMLNHRSIRKFKNSPLTEAQIQTIVKAAQMAPSAFHSQPFTIIGVTDPQLKKQLSIHAENDEAYTQCGYLFIFCLDLHRLMVTASPEQQEKMRNNLSSVYMNQTTLLSAGIALQNASLAAESLGLGTVILGSVNNALPALDEWLKLPEYVIPLAALAVGVPDEEPEQKPRLPLHAVFHENHYPPQVKEAVEQYDREIEAYYQQRTTNQRIATWSQRIIGLLSRDLPLGFYTKYLNLKGFTFK